MKNERNGVIDLQVDFEAAGFDPVEELARLNKIKNSVIRGFDENREVNTVEFVNLASRQASAYAELTGQQIEIMKLMAMKR